MTFVTICSGDLYYEWGVKKFDSIDYKSRDAMICDVGEF